MKQTLTLLLAMVFALPGISKKKIGEWQDYLSYAKTYKIAIAGNIVYCASEGGLFYYDISDNSVNKISGNYELSDFGIKTIAYDEANDILLVAYTNSNIDLIQDGKVFNISDIKRKSIMGNKSINNILFVGDVAYLSCGFGVVALNLLKREVKDTYIIGENSSQINVFDMEFDGQYLYAGTQNGLLFADIDDPNLLDYNSWRKVPYFEGYPGTFNNLAYHNGQVVVSYSTGQYNTNNLYTLTNGNWERYLPQINYLIEMQVNENYLTITTPSSVYIIDSNHTIVDQINSYPFSKETVTNIDLRSSAYKNGSGLWISDYQLGLIKATSDVYESVFPDGPLDNSAFYLYANGSDLFVASGVMVGWKFPQLQLYRDNTWTYFTKKEYPELSSFWNFVNVIADPSNPDHFYVGSWGGGLLEFNNGELVERYLTSNSSLQTIIESEPDLYVRIGGMDFDSQGNLWITNSEVPNVLSVKKKDGEWESYNLPEIANDKSIGQIIVNESDDKWIIVPSGHDLYVVKNDLSQKIHLKVQSYFNNGETELITNMSDVFSIAEDQDGAIWVGTSQGVAVYFNPWRLWDDGFMYATHPSLDLNDGLYHPLLEKETVTAIVVDGANRKWLGTENSGVYLVSSDGETELEHFTSENSPLLSNVINSIAINHKNGEVFFGTEKGIISYQGDAIEGDSDYSNVYVYPNPVRETYSGSIVVTGLVAESNVKITDISGNLVYETTSVGGQAIWDGKNLNGNRVKTGVYLIFCNDQYGEKTHISKLLFIN